MTAAYLTPTPPSVWPQRMMTVLLLAMMCMGTSPCLAQSISTLVHFENCRTISVQKVYDLLRIELSNPVEANVTQVTVACGRNFRVHLGLHIRGGQTLSRSIYLQRYEDGDRERVLALAISEIVTEAGQWSAEREETVLPNRKADKEIRKSEHGSPRHVSRLRHRQESLRGVGPLVAWQHMNRIHLLGPGGAFLRLYPVGFGWQWEASTLFARDDTAVGQVKTVVASTSLVPCMAWQRARFRWHVGLGIRVGMARMEGLPLSDSTHRGNVITGAWYGPVATANMGMVTGRVLMSVSVEAGFSVAAVVGHALEDDIAVGDFWLRPGFFIAYVFQGEPK